jgi:hypothetical protein
MRRVKSRTRIGFAGLVALVVVSFLGAARQTPVVEKRAVALIVNPDNSTRDVSFAHLRAFMRLDRRFWPDKSRVVLFLPRSGSDVKQALNDQIYGMTEKKLRKYWTGKVFSGDIPSVPQVVKTPSAAGKLVAGTRGAISAVLFDDVPTGVRILSVDGKQPGDEGYPLTFEVEASTAVE